ncbi:hypothetical protein [Nocardioides phosphati]|nr:hypothetical protein [Nocardioides phosphati]
MLGNFNSFEEAHEHALWAAQRYQSDVEIYDIEDDKVVEDVPAPN